MNGECPDTFDMETTTGNLKKIKFLRIAFSQPTGI